MQPIKIEGNSGLINPREGLQSPIEDAKRYNAKKHKELADTAMESAVFTRMLKKVQELAGLEILEEK